MDDLFAFIAKEKDKGLDENLVKLQKGTVLFYSAVESHCYMYLGSVYGAEHCRVHARAAKEPTGVYIDKMPKVNGSNTRAFKCLDATLIQTALMYITEWALVAPDLNIPESVLPYEEYFKADAGFGTAFSFARYGNLVSCSGSADPFTTESLRRALKYASRYITHPLSKNKGTTCTALIVSAYQAAVLHGFCNGNFTLLTTAYKEMKKYKGINVSLTDAWTAVHQILLPDAVKFYELSDVFPSSLLLESKTVNAGKPWTELMENDKKLWVEIKLTIV